MSIAQNTYNRLDQALSVMRRVSIAMTDALEEFDEASPLLLTLIEEQRTLIDQITTSDDVTIDLQEARDAAEFSELYNYHEDGEHSLYTKEEWCVAVGLGTTIRGYADWVRERLDQKENEKGHE